MGTRADDRERDIVVSIRNLTKVADQQTSLIKTRWRENYDMFVNGSQNTEKEDWQTSFSVNKLQTSVYAAQGRLVNTLVNTPDWFELDPKSDLNQQAEVLAPALRKALDYYLTGAKFKRHAGTFFLCSLISMGSMHVGWKQRLVQNPEYVLDKTKRERQREQERLASKVANPQNEFDISGQDMENQLLAALEDFTSQAQGLDPVKRKIPPYIQQGTLDFMDINHERQFWEPNVMYMEDSPWRSFKYDVTRYELNQWAKWGYFSKDKVKKIASQSQISQRAALNNFRYSNTIRPAASKTELIELHVYYGPLILDGEIVKDRYFAIIANDSVLIKEGEYPYWEPPGHTTPIISAAVRQIPYRATGAGIGDNAVQLQKIYDSNWQLVCDSFRNGISGINVINRSNLVDKSQLDEGIYPGMTLEVRGNPKDSFQHIDLTSNLENQAHPVQTMLEQAIDSLTGINELMTGGSNPYSRTAAAETNARVSAGNENVNIIALDLEQNFLIPVLEKCFARVLQFGLDNIDGNPELKALFTDEELYELSQLDARSKLEILNQWYNFKIKGFSSAQDTNEEAQRDNEFLSIINSGGPLAPFINIPNFLKRYFKNRGVKNPDELLMINNTPYQQVINENQVLMAGHLVVPAQNDDHQFHLQQHMALAQSGFGTPAMQQHVQYHQMMLQQMQQAQAAQGQGQPGQPQQGQPPIQ